MQGRLPIIASLGIGILAILALNFYVEGIRQELQPASSTIMVAARDLRAGGILEAKDIAAGQKPRNALPTLHIRWEERSLYLGQPLEFEVKQGDYVLASYFGGQSVSAQRPSDRIDGNLGQRAFTMPVTNETSLERSIRSGDRIDLLLTYREPVDPRQGISLAKLVTTSLLENVYVLYTGRYGSRVGDYSSITLLVSPEEAKLLIWARNLGDVAVLLRNSKDLQETDRVSLTGNVKSLDSLSSREIKIDEIVEQNQSAEAP